MHKDEVKKLKSFAVKLKKELTDMKQKVLYQVAVVVLSGG